MVDVWNFFLPASAVPLALYLTSLVFGQSSVLPADLNYRFSQQPLLGAGRGLWGPAAALMVGAACAVLQGRGDEAMVLALGAHLGTVLNSFLKRRLGLARGQDFFPFDNIDFAVGAAVCYHIQYGMSAQLFFSGVLICGFAHRYIGRVIRWSLKGLQNEADLENM